MADKVLPEETALKLIGELRGQRLLAFLQLLGKLSEDFPLEVIHPRHGHRSVQ